MLDSVPILKGHEQHLVELYRHSEGKDSCKEKTLGKEKPPRPPSPKLYFYLRLPHRSSAARTCVLPLAEQATLRDVLRGQVVREFPTIEALERSPEELSQTSYELARGPTHHDEQAGSEPPQKRRCPDMSGNSRVTDG